MFSLSEIYIYPVKSLGGISLETSFVESRGLRYDRRWLLVDETGKFITQRTHPEMALIKVELREQVLEFKHRNGDEFFVINKESFSNEKIEVKIWNDTITANIVNKKADEWFSEMLNMKCRFIYMPDNVMRPVEKNFSQGKEIVSFADAFPFLIIGQSSLDDLNSRLKEKLPMNRFRPNLVFKGGKPFDEDKIKSFTIGDITFYPVKPCARCVVTTINQDNSTKSDEPLKTLSSYRTFNNKVLFGQNMIHSGKGIISVGDEIKNIEWK